MNISGIRTGAGFYDYNSIKINEVRKPADSGGKGERADTGNGYCGTE